MDPLVVAGVQFLLAILGGGIVAVIAQRLAFRDARQLQAEDRAASAASRRDALAAELRENARRVESVLRDQIPGARIIRAAWDDARGDIRDDALFAAIASAYTQGAELERYADFIVDRVAQGGVAHKFLPEARAREKVQELALAHARVTHSAFVEALKMLEKSD